MNAEIIDKRTLWEGWSRLLAVRVRTAHGSEVTRTVEDHGSAAAVLPYDPARRMALLVRQLRVPMLLAHAMASTLEAPAGLVDSGDPALCVRRDCVEVDTRCVERRCARRRNTRARRTSTYTIVVVQ